LGCLIDIYIPEEPIAPPPTITTSASCSCFAAAENNLLVFGPNRVLLSATLAAAIAVERKSLPDTSMFADCYTVPTAHNDAPTAMASFGKAEQHNKLASVTNDPCLPTTATVVLLA
jgi:hypothetical protein